MQAFIILALIYLDTLVTLKNAVYNVQGPVVQN